MRLIVVSLLLVSGVAFAADLPSPKPIECTLGDSAFRVRSTVLGDVDASNADGHGHLQKQFNLADYPGYSLVATSFVGTFNDGLADVVQIRIKNPQQANTEPGDSMVTVTGLSMTEVWLDLGGKFAAARCHVK